MNFITQLLPGLRDVRGPLVAGYLWLFAGWLLFGESLPDRDTTEATYQQTIELGDALGQVGILAVVSVAAYLVGSLLQALISWIDFAYKSLKQRTGRFPFPFGLGSGSTGPVMVQTSLFSPPVLSFEDFRFVDGDTQTKRALNDLVSNRLGACFAKLDVAIDEAVAKVRVGADRGSWSRDELDSATIEIDPVEYAEGGWWIVGWIASIGYQEVASERLERPVSLPSFSAATDLFGERSTIQTRLLETTEQAGSEVERLYSESDFRFTVLFPLAAVAVALAAETGDRWWLGLLAAVLGLLAHSVVLRKHGGREMVEALRSRPDSEELDQITPVFRRYEEEAKKFIVALRGERWEELGAAIPLEGAASADPLQREA